ncbi:MAG: hypothetical protein AB7F59_05120 [Bdellovibrionales bacterium]
MTKWGFVALLALVGCIEKEKMEVPPAVACESVESTLNTAIGGSENRLAEEDWVHFEDSIAPTSQPATILADQLNKIIKLIQVGTTTPPVYEIRSLETTISYKNGQQQKETREVVEQGPTTFALCPSSSAVSYHGLGAGQTKVSALQYKDSCGSFVDCKITVTHMNFDQLITFPDGTQEAAKYHLVLSAEVPYAGRFLETCVTQGYEVNGQKIPATRCKRVRNFGFKTE